jgi:hypothetical protein
MKILATLLIAGALVGPAFAEPRSANARVGPSANALSQGPVAQFHTASDGGHKAGALNSGGNDADKDFDNDTLHPEGSQR